MKKHIIKTIAVCSAVALCVSFAGCKDKDEQQASSVPSVLETESTVSELLPVKSTFPEKYTFIKSGDNEYNIKGNSAFSVKKGSATQYDPNTLEGITHEGTFTLTNDVGVGSKCSELMELFGITLGYYSSHDDKGNPIDPFEGGDADFTVMAIMSYDEDTQKVTYSAGGKVVEHMEGITQAGGSYLKDTTLGKDLLIVTINAKKNATVESFSVEHYIF